MTRCLRTVSMCLVLAVASALQIGAPTIRPTAASACAVRGEGAASARRQLRAGEPTMMAKKVSKMIKLALPAGGANPAPPVGPALGAAGVNIMGFCKEYNVAPTRC